MHLRSLTRAGHNPSKADGFPFNVPIIRTLDRIDLDAPVTFLVGENGSGKSTLLEAIACAMRAVTVGSENVATDATLADVRRFARTLRLTWSTRTHRGFFLRAEDFFGYAKRVAQMHAEARESIEQVDGEYEGRSPLAKALAKGPHARTIGELRERYGDGLDTQSHGESFLKLFQSRLVPKGVYLLDEPEAPLSPLRQLAFLSLLKAAVKEESQFIIATHSPIILAFPDAKILSCDQTPITAVAYEDLEHYTLTKAFLNDPDQYLSRL